MKVEEANSELHRRSHAPPKLRLKAAGRASLLTVLEEAAARQSTSEKKSAPKRERERTPSDDEDAQSEVG
ncbi:hypothetical protein QR680_016168 [Steinernema hermaphroditum]|uniref:Uncharacterized protein n=1 Tax=Steinernema hermaphroditum TaxID=289476 RepID=A0AA39LM57_9BILA|nr:hypothetical protein QR680_016168 [Steinernema hermaphroditum]